MCSFRGQTVANVTGKENTETRNTKFVKTRGSCRNGKCCTLQRVASNTAQVRSTATPSFRAPAARSLRASVPPYLRTFVPSYHRTPPFLCTSLST
ncbi:hypothetical protein WN55_04465 [Dufourea novaeangliae]|uniref:Uncharacterized protein n=1 Tax=Dufourea novaeangliae TaxID=178035 RepID=A0A154PM68_DUFNO|nr:hypothetical protein WN55_04465 [Dufourea novaeangliae]